MYRIGQAIDEKMLADSLLQDLASLLA